MSTPRVDHALVSLTNPASFAAEQYHGLGLKVERLRLARDIRVMGVTSPGIGDGKTVTAINLAAALARGTDARVLLVDADLRRPAITGHLALDIPRPDLPPKGGSHEEPDLPPEGGSHEEKGHGLADLVIDPNVSIQDAVRPIVFSDCTFSLISAGTAPASVHKILRSPRFEETLRDLRSHYDYVVLDTPPLVPVFDSSLLSRTLDGVLLVVAANRTPRKLCEEALNLLDPGKVLGIVFNGDERPFGAYYRGYQRYFASAATGMRELRSWLP